MECPGCHCKVTFRDTAGGRCPDCAIKIYLSDNKWRWLRGIGCVLLTALVIYHWFPRTADLGAFLRWIAAFVGIFYVLFIGSMFILTPNVDLVPPRGPIRLDI